MPRPAGVRNHDFEEKRFALLDQLTDFALNDDLRRPSLRQFAIAAGASEPTLRHYFSDRQGVVIAILNHIHDRGVSLWDVIKTPSKDAASAVEEYFRVTQAGLTHGGFARAHAFGLIEGMADEVVGQAYLKALLDPALKAVQEKLEATAGDIYLGESGRAAAFMMLAPILVMTLHQQLLGGAESSAIEPDSFLNQIQNWLVSGLPGKGAA
ncbi:MAG: TetR/AcrR family transcriptional regulator [Pseudomonadota bacterium]